MSALVARDPPAVARGLTAWPSIRPGAYRLASIQGRSVADNREMTGTPFGALPWLIIAPGAVLAALGGAALRLTPPDRRRLGVQPAP